MIRVILQGRTGNNFFQYAAGRALAVKHSTSLILDGAWADQALKNQLDGLKRLPLAGAYRRAFPNAKRVLRKLGYDCVRLHRDTVFQEKSGPFDPAFKQLPDGTLLTGYFQNPEYFKGIEPLLRKELDLSGIAMPASAARIETLIQEAPTASLHVRRGDYLNIGATQCLPETYHQDAIRLLRDRHDGIRFCVFSDDIPWCRDHFKQPGFFFADCPDAAGDPFIDLRLMAACDHHIIVNSSYSWWGAWLNPDPEKIVVSPSLWMKNLPAEAVIPKEWIRI